MMSVGSSTCIGLSSIYGHFRTWPINQLAPSLAQNRHSALLVVAGRVEAS